jgi:aspartate carbamoyltransferase catalytic subunit
MNVFYEPSTRTRTSFEVAGKRLGADVVNINIAQSSVTKGETLLDTFYTLEAMGCDAFVIRHPASGAAHYVASKVKCSVINAGDGMHEHPTQALLDAYTIRERKGRIEKLRIAICGDVSHSRVARSLIRLLKKFDCELRVTGPGTMLPINSESLGVQVCKTVEEAMEGADVVVALRIQNERIKGALLPSHADYAAAFGITEERLKHAKPDAIVMHPGPINRGVEISNAVADGPRSAILTQVDAGVSVRMAVLSLLCQS